MKERYKLMRDALKLMYITFCLTTTATLLPNVSLAHDEFTKLIEKADFVNFEKVYGNQHMSTQQKLQLIAQVDLVVDDSIKNIKKLNENAAISLNTLKRLKLNTYILLTSAIISASLSIAIFYLLFDMNRRIKYFRRPAVNRFATANSETIRDRFYVNCISRLVHDCKEGNILVGFTSFWAILSSFFYRKNRLLLGYYVRWEKSLKIKKLLEDSMPLMPEESP